MLYLCCVLFVVFVCLLFTLMCAILMRAGTTVEQVRKTWGWEEARGKLAHG